MVTYDELFALRVSLQDDYTDEADIIRQLKTFLLQSLQLEEIDDYLHNFYNSFGINISVEDLKEIKLDRRQIRRIQRSNLQSFNSFSSSFFPSQNTPTIPENETVNPIDSINGNTNPGDSNTNESNDVNTMNIVNTTNSTDTINSSQLFNNDQFLDQILDDVINNMEDENNEVSEVEYSDDENIDDENIDDDPDTNQQDLNNSDDMDTNNQFHPNNLAQYFQVDESGNINLTPLLSGFFVGSSQDNSSIDFSQNFQELSSSYDQIMSNYDELSNLMINNPIYPQFTVNLGEESSNNIQSEDDSFDVSENEQNNSMENNQDDRLQSNHNNEMETNNNSNNNRIHTSINRTRNNLIRRLNHPEGVSRRVQRRSTLGPAFMQTALTNLIMPQQMQGFYNQLPMPSQGIHMEDVKVTLEDNDLDNIVTDKFKSIIEKEILDNESDSESQSKYKCTICMMKFEEEDMVSKLKCNHIFHEDCIKEWLKEYSYKCPVCRAECGKPKYDL
tara:strand:+ start:4681 stop:6186 length:1506 start_codon:yes stop_codon:yes gene_type:complete